MIRQNRIFMGHMNKKDLFTLFLMVIFPVHLWSFFASLYNMETVVTRSTSVFDGVGYAAYALLYALFESTLLFLLMAVLGTLLPRRWPAEVKLVQLSLLSWVISLWAAFGQFYRYRLYGWLKAPIDYLFLWLSYRRMFNSVLLGLILGFIIISVALPIWLLRRRPEMKSWWLKVFDKVSILSMFYLMLDLCALLVVVFRNLWVLL